MQSPRIKISLFLVAVFLFGGCAGIPEKRMTLRWFGPAGSDKATVETPARFSKKLKRRKSLTVKKELMRHAWRFYQKNPRRKDAALLACRSLFLVVEVLEDEKSIPFLAEKGLKASIDAGSGKDPRASYYHALFLGLIINQKGLMALGRLKEVVSMLEVARKEPDYDFGGPLRLSGMVYLKAPPWPRGIGDLDRSLDALQKAAGKFSSFPQNNIFLAEAYIEDDEKKKAKELLAQAMKNLEPALWGKEYCETWKKYIVKLQKKIK